MATKQAKQGGTMLLFEVNLGDDHGIISPVPEQKPFTPPQRSMPPLTRGKRNHLRPLNKPLSPLIETFLDTRPRSSPPADIESPIDPGLVPSALRTPTHRFTASTNDLPQSPTFSSPPLSPRNWPQPPNAGSRPALRSPRSSPNLSEVSRSPDLADLSRESMWSPISPFSEALTTPDTPSMPSPLRTSSNLRKSTYPDDVDVHLFAAALSGFAPDDTGAHYTSYRASITSIPSISVAAPGASASPAYTLPSPHTLQNLPPRQWLETLEAQRERDDQEREAGDELPDYAQSQLQAAAQARLKASNRAMELERKWAARSGVGGR